MTTRTITRRRKMLAGAGLGAMALTAFGIPAASMADTGDSDSGEEKTDGLPAEITVEDDVSGDLAFPIATGAHVLEPELVGVADLPDGMDADDEGRLIPTSAQDRTWETGGLTTLTINLPDGDKRLVHIDGVGADDGEDPD